MHFGVPGGWITATVLIVAFAVLLVVSLRHLLRHPLEPRTRRALLVLRVITLGLACTIAVRPGYEADVYREEEGQLLVLIDDSRSMRLSASGESADARDVSAAPSADSRGALATEIAAHFEGEQVEIRRFSDASSSIGGPLQFRGGASNIGEVLSALRSGDGTRFGGVILITDGADTGEPFVAQEGDAHVFSVPIGTTPSFDDAIAGLSADPVAFLRQEAQVQAVLRRIGRGGTARVTLRREGELLAEHLATFIEQEDGTFRSDVTFPFVADRLGRSIYTVEIEESPGDAVPQNNRQSFLLRVQRDRLRVLLVAGRPSWDVRFLREFLEEDGGVDLISFFILRSTTDTPDAPDSELALIPFPTDELFREHLGSFDLIIFQDFDFGPYAMSAFLPGIARYVERGGSFAMVGGQGSFGAGRYGATSIASILPVEFEDVSIPARGIDEAAFHPVITTGFERHPVVSLNDDPVLNVERWASLADVIGTNLVRRAKPGARVLLEHAERSMPVLTISEAGEGRVLALTIDSSWRWGMTSALSTGNASAHARFWDQALRWLSRDPSLEPARITTDAARYSAGAPVRVSVQLRTDQYEALSEATLELARADEDNSERLLQRALTLDDVGRASLEITSPSEGGIYVLRARGQRRDADIEVFTEEPLVVEGGGDELAEVRVMDDYLSEISDATGGEVLDTSSLPPRESLNTTRRRFEGRQAHYPLGVLAACLLAALLGMEWLLRRRAGLS